VDRITRFVTGGGLPAFALLLLVFYQALLVAVLFAPPAPTGLGSFAEEFRVWCFGYDPGTGSMEWGLVMGMLVPPLMVGGLFLLLWWEQLRDLVRHPAALARPAAAAATLVGAMAWSFALLGGAPQAGELPFPAEALRTRHRPPEISLVSHTGERVELARMKGEVVLLTAVYATCPHTCPLILAQAKNAIAELDPGERAALRVIGVTIDPSNDTPSVLADLAERHDLSAPLYNLVTGEAAEVERVLDEIGVARQYNETTGQIDHANLFVLVDRGGRVAYRFTLGERQQRWLVSGLRVLLREPSLPQRQDDLG